MGDRRSIGPTHVGDLVLPSNPLFSKLLTLATKIKPRPAIRDVNAGVERTAAELLSDILNLRRILRSQLDGSVIRKLENGEEIYVNVLAQGGYEFAVGALAILASGAAISPLSVAYPADEATYFVNKARAVALLASKSALSQAETLAQKVRDSTDPNYQCVSIASGIGQSPISPSKVQLSSSGYTDPNKPGLVIFTSGTTGRPKGAVLPHAAIDDGAMSFACQLGLTDQDTLQHLLPIHHATGIWVSFFPFLLTGATIEFRAGSFDPAWTWERWRQGGLTHFTGVPTIYMRLMRYYQEVISKLPNEERKSYEDAAKQFKCCLCGTSALPKPINDFWRQMFGRRIAERYGSTELGVIFSQSFEDNSSVPDGSVGEVSLGCDVKLAEGDEGEVLARSWSMFSKYLHDPEATKAAHDEQGYFRSGDVARREGKFYYITGRASVDVLKSGGYKISALDVEREILGLPYIGEVMVVGVPDAEFGQRVGAVVSLRNDDVARSFYYKHGRSAEVLKLDDLRADIRDRLAGYKLPTLLRIVKGELPKSGTGKIVKKTLGPRYFPENYHQDAEVQRWSSHKSPTLAKL